jgi:hypothetical protein
MAYPGLLANGSLLPSIAPATVRAELGLTAVNVKDYGVDSAAFESAMDAAITAGVPVYVPPGSYSIGDLSYTPATDAELVIVGGGKESTIVTGALSADSFIVLPDSFTGKISIENIHLKDFYKTIDFSTWLGGSASTIQSIEIDNCKFTQGTTTGNRSFLYCNGDLKRSHLIESLNIKHSYFEMETNESARMLALQGSPINNLIIDSNEFVAGTVAVYWMPTLPDGERDDIAQYLPSPKITNNIFRDITATAANTSFIYLAGLGVDISHNTFKNMNGNGQSTTSGMYLQCNGNVSHNEFIDVYGEIGNIYSKGSNKYDGAKISTVSRTSNVVEVVTVKPHGRSTSDVVDVTGSAVAGVDSTDNTITVTDSRTFTFANTGADVASTADPLGYAYSGLKRSGYDLDVNFNRFRHTARTQACSGIYFVSGNHSARFNTFDGFYSGSSSTDAPIRLTDPDDDFYDILIEGNRFRACESFTYIKVATQVKDNFRIINNTASDPSPNQGGIFLPIISTGNIQRFCFQWKHGDQQQSRQKHNDYA